MSRALQLLNQYESDGDVQSDSDIVSEEPKEEESVLEVVRQTLSTILAKVERNNQPHDAFTEFRFTNNEDEIDLSSTSSLTDSDDDVIKGTLEDILDDDCDDSSRLPPRTPGELGLEDLPPIEQLTIKARVEDLVHLGRIVSVIDCLISVQSFKGQPALDLDSVLFLKDGNPLGTVFEVFGPVKEPRYLVRFNSRNEIEERHLKVDLAVYCAPILGAPITSYVFTTDLMKMKGSDASWKHNNEPPDEIREFSDDEEERMFKLKSKGKRKSTSGNFGNNSPMTRRTQPFASPSSLRAPPNTPANNFGRSMPRRRQDGFFP